MKWQSCERNESIPSIMEEGSAKENPTRGSEGKKMWRKITGPNEKQGGTKTLVKKGPPSDIALLVWLGQLQRRDSPGPWSVPYADSILPSTGIRCSATYMWVCLHVLYLWFIPAPVGR